MGTEKASEGGTNQVGSGTRTVYLRFSRTRKTKWLGRVEDLRGNLGKTKVLDNRNQKEDSSFRYRRLNNHTKKGITKLSHHFFLTRIIKDIIIKMQLHEKEVVGTWGSNDHL